MFNLLLSDIFKTNIAIVVPIRSLKYLLQSFHIRVCRLPHLLRPPTINMLPNRILHRTHSTTPNVFDVSTMNHAQRRQLHNFFCWITRCSLSLSPRIHFSLSIWPWQTHHKFEHNKLQASNQPIPIAISRFQILPVTPTDTTKWRYWSPTSTTQLKWKFILQA